MEGKLILYYIVLMFGVTWAIGGLIRASNDLCRSAKQDYQRPKGQDDGDST